MAGEKVVSIFRKFSVGKLFEFVRRLLTRHESGENVDNELTAVGEELSRRGVGRDVNVEPEDAPANDK